MKLLKRVGLFVCWFASAMTGSLNSAKRMIPLLLILALGVSGCSGENRKSIDERVSDLEAQQSAIKDYLNVSYLPIDETYALSPDGVRLTREKFVMKKWELCDKCGRFK